MNQFLICILLFPILFSNSSVPSKLSSEAVVHAVIFYSPSCGHCQYVISEVLPPLFAKYGDQLQMVGIDATQPGGQMLFQATIVKFKLDSAGVPFLVVGDTYLVGSVDIPEKFPGLIEQYLAQGGVDWPDIPGLAEVLANSQATETPAPSPTAPLPTSRPTRVISSPTAPPPVKESTPTATPGLLLGSPGSFDLGTRLAQDPLGNTFAIIVLIGMIASVAAAALFFRRIPGLPLSYAWGWLIPALCLIGFGVAGYLAHVETNHVQAICGPVGDCNTVQQSEYARLFGILPIGILGLFGYGAILLTWVVGRFANHQLASYACLALLGMSAFGVLFSIYLTFLEPFVIGATCAWCLTSAVIMTALLWLSLAPGRKAFRVWDSS
jgi:uncharacterized membrane protein